MSRAPLVAAAVTAAVLGLAGCADPGAPVPAARAGTAAAPPVPTFAYVDALGHRTDPATRRWMRTAVAAGVDGFLVTWRHAPGPDRRLAGLVATARAEHAHLGLVYRAVDGRGRALPARTVAAGIAWFAAHHGRDPVFAYFERPLVVWAGTDRYPAAAVAAVAARVRPRVLLLASATDAAGYSRLHDHVDGDAYDPAAPRPPAPAYGARLAAVAGAVHEGGGLWIAPAGSGAATLAGQLAAARDSGADAVALGGPAGAGAPAATLGAVGAVLGAGVRVADSPDSSSSDGSHGGLAGPIAVGVIGALLVGGTAALALRRWLPGPWRRRGPGA